MEFMYITNNVEVAKVLDNVGVIPWVDLEVLGKEERQKNMNTVKSNHCIDDIKKIKKNLKKMPLLVRINPINMNSEKEIDDVIAAGADLVMLPMFKTKSEVAKFVKYVNKRVKTMLLFETQESVFNIDDILSVAGIDEVHIGLNDLHLSYGLNFMFELLVNGTVDFMCQKFNEHKIPYGFGGVSRIGNGDLPAEFIILEHIRLKSSRVILSRGFCNILDYNNILDFSNVFKDELRKIILFENIGAVSSGKFLNENHLIAEKLIEKIKGDY